jgi:hypothetical protein
MSFKVADIVYCSINDRGVVIAVDANKNKITVEFDNEIRFNYTLDGRMYISETTISKNVSLFKERPYIVTDKALFDVDRNIIDDKDLIIFGDKNNYIFNAGFYDAQNNSLFTKEGCRSNKNIFDVVSNNMFILKINTDSDKINEIRAKLRDEVINDTHTRENGLEGDCLAIPDVFDVISSDVKKIEKKDGVITDNVATTKKEQPIEKTATEKKEENILKSIPVTFEDAEIVETVPEELVLVENKDTFFVKGKNNRHFKVTFEKNHGFDVKTVVTIGGDSEIIAKSSYSDIKPSEYINVYDVFVIKPGKEGKEYEYINISHSSVRFKKVKGNIKIELD